MAALRSLCSAPAMLIASAERLLARPGTLEFRILARPDKDKTVVAQAQKDQSKAEVLDRAGKRLAWWVPVKAGEEKSFADDPNVVRRTKTRDHREVTEVLVVADHCNVTGRYLTKVKSRADNMGNPSIEFTLNEDGGNLFAKLTSDHLPDRSTSFSYTLGIIVDGELYSAPRIMSAISDQGRITGNFTAAEASNLAESLNAGSLPVRIRLAPKFVAARRLHEIALAMYGYYEANGHFPPAILYGPSGKQLYSWRVALLPYLGQKRLYDWYDFDEAWDSRHNRKVLEQMPDVFCCLEKPAESKNASYFALVGQGAIFDGKQGTKLEEITDGTSCTILLVEAKRDIPWTKPEDIPYDPHTPMPALGGCFPDGFHVAMADASVRFIPSTVSEKVLRALISKAGGKPVEIPVEAKETQPETDSESKPPALGQATKLKLDVPSVLSSLREQAARQADAMRYGQVNYKRINNVWRSGMGEKFHAKPSSAVAQGKLYFDEDNLCLDAEEGQQQSTGAHADADGPSTVEHWHRVLTKKWVAEWDGQSDVIHIWDPPGDFIPQRFDPRVMSKVVVADSDGLSVKQVVYEGAHVLPTGRGVFGGRCAPRPGSRS